MIGYPLDSKVEYDSEGRPTYDRAITSKPLRKLYSQLFSTGVMPNPSDNFQVMAGDAGMTVKVNPGFAVVKGCLKLEETIRTIEIQAASSSLDRIDTVVLRLNDEVNARICDLYVRQGIPASSPTRPDLVRSGSVYEIGLADIFIPANTATIVQKRITDTRLDPDRCGYVSSISKFDTETLYLQIQNDLADFKLNEQAEFLEWFEYIKVQLSEDVAGNLQNQIGVLLNLKTEIKTDLVNAINWLQENIDTLNSNLKSKVKSYSSIPSASDLKSAIAVFCALRNSVDTFSSFQGLVPNMKTKYIDISTGSVVLKDITWSKTNGTITGDISSFEVRFVCIF